jgi:hypothetical protein
LFPWLFTFEACRRLNHCIHLLGGELAIENIKMKKKRGKEKKEKEKEEEELGRRQPLLQGLEGSVLRNVLRVNSVRCPKLVQNPMDNIWHIRRFSSARCHGPTSREHSREPNRCARDKRLGF